MMENWRDFRHNVKILAFSLKSAHTHRKPMVIYACNLAKSYDSQSSLQVVQPNRPLVSHFAPFRPISPHFASFLLISPHFASFRLISPHFASFRLISPHFASFRLISPHFAFRPISPHFAPFRPSTTAIWKWMMFYSVIAK
jgi:hypothetical protein